MKSEDNDPSVPRGGVIRHYSGLLRFYLLIGLLRLMRFYLVTGMLVWAPLLVTIWLTWWLFKNVGGGLESLIKPGFEYVKGLATRVEWLGWVQQFDYQPGWGFLIAGALFITTGFLTRYLIGRRFIAHGENILQRIPLISRVYGAVQQIRDVFVSREGTVFQKVCMVQYPRKGMWAVAFITSHEQGLVQDTIGEEVISIFMPTTPNPTSGFLMYVKPEEVDVLDVTVEDAMKLIISGGAFLPTPKSKKTIEELREQGEEPNGQTVDTTVGADSR